MMPKYVYELKLIKAVSRYRKPQLQVVKITKLLPFF